MPDRHVLIFCPWIDGHRQNHCCVYALWFRDRGYQATLAAGRDANGTPAVDTPVIGALAKYPGIEVHDLGDTTGSHLQWRRWVETLLSLESRLAPAWTLLPTGDEIRRSLHGLGTERRSQGLRRAGTFIGGHHIYPRDFRHGPLWKRPHRWVLTKRWARREEAFFRVGVWDSLGLDVALATNPDLVSSIADPRYHYLPDLYRAWGLDQAAPVELVERLSTSFRAFLDRQGGRQIVLYFGSWQARRGYDVLLQIVAKRPDTVFVGCGRPFPDNRFLHPVSELKQQLLDEDRVFEVEIPFFPENSFVDLLFSSAQFVALPYREFYGNSGSLVQATAYGLPVLVPDIGYLASMVQRRGIGLTYRHRSEEDFERQFSIMTRDHALYSGAAAAFGREFDRRAVSRALSVAFDEE